MHTSKRKRICYDYSELVQTPENRYCLQFDLDELQKTRQTFILSDNDIDAPKALTFELADFGNLNSYRVAFELADLQLTSLTVDLKELQRVERKWKAQRTKFKLLDFCIRRNLL